MTHRSAPSPTLPDLPAFTDLPAQADPPDALRTFAGQRVTTPDMWREQRRSELLALFSHYVYGPRPPAPAHPPRTRELMRDRTLLDGRAELREIELHLDEPRDITMRLLLALPRDRDAPAPTLLAFNRCGNHATHPHPQIQLPERWVPFTDTQGEHRADDAQRGSRAHLWPIERIVARGYALALWYPGDVSPDDPQFRFSFSSPNGERVQTGTIAAWAWGASRALDALVKMPEVDASRVGVLGHSRRGKTALLAAAFDERFALVIPHQAGCGGTAPSRTRNPRAETVKRINTTFPHWFGERFAQFGDAVERLPIDQHALIALAAPRPVLLSNAEDDQWADPPGQMHMLKAAEPVYHLLGTTGLAGATQPRMQALVGDTLAYFLRPGRHDITAEDWGAFLDFADRHLKPEHEA
ncbi:MAG: acetylxylan esterase [Phycisphaeraceae bacterium]